MKHTTLEDVTAYPPVLDATLVTRIHELNRDFIDLLVERYAAGGSTSLLLPHSIMESMAMLGDAQRDALARTSYALYTLGLDSFSHAGVAKSGEAGWSAPAPCGHADDAQTAFCEVAIFLAWHSAVSNPLAARVVYGLPDAALQRLSATPLAYVRRIAAQQSSLLMPRWASNPRFWPDLVRFAANDDSRRLTAAQLLGNQLLAADIERARRRGRSHHS